jgi:hypothetical protein
MKVDALLCKRSFCVKKKTGPCRLAVELLPASHGRHRQLRKGFFFLMKGEHVDVDLLGGGVRKNN